MDIPIPLECMYKICDTFDMCERVEYRNTFKRL